MQEPNTIEYRAASFVESVLPRATLSSTSPEALVDAIADEMLGGDRPDLIEIAERLGAPASDMLATVLSARATLMAAARGRAFYQHELRGRIPMADGLLPEVEVWEEGTVPVWTDGVYVEPKYFSFRQDAPFAAYNPVHRKKWRPHELLHGAVGFFWREDASRFETYSGSRLNELLPVVHWYGLDEIFRPRCEDHAGEVLYRDFCPACEAAVRPYWEVEPKGRLAAIRFVHSAQEHFGRELEACREEIQTGVVRETPLGRLNASTDAVGYMMGHWNRLNSTSFRTWVDLFLREGFDYFSDLHAYANRVEACAARLVGGVVTANLSRVEALRQRRILQDVGYRALLAMEWLDLAAPADQAVERTILGALERCSAAVDTLVESDDALWDADDALEHLWEVLEDVRDGLPEDVAAPLLALGLDFWDRGRDREFESSNLAEGISQGARLTAACVDAGHIETFSESEVFSQPGRLISRFAAYLRDRAVMSEGYGDVADLATLEAWAVEDPQRDEHGERFAQEFSSLDKIDPGHLRINRTIRRSTFGAAAVAQLADAEFDGESVNLVAAYWRGELHLLILDEQVATTLEKIENGILPEDEEAVMVLMEAGIVLWVPTGPLQAKE